MDICLNEDYTETRCNKCGTDYTSYSCFKIMKPEGVFEVINNFDCPKCSLEQKLREPLN